MPYGFAMHEELNVLVRDIGLSNYEAIKAATYNNASWIGILDTVGTVEEGKRADLILVSRNPLKKLKSLKNLDGAGVSSTPAR